MKTAIQSATLALLLLLSALTFEVVRDVVPQAQKTMEQITMEVHAQSVSLLYTQKALRDSMVVTAAQVIKARQDMDLAVMVADHHLEVANATVDRLAGFVAVSTVSVAKSADNVAAGATQIESRMDDAIDLTFNCDQDNGGSVDCFHNRYVGAAKATEQAAKDMQVMAKSWSDTAKAQADATTEILKNTEATTANTATISARFAKKPPIWMTILSWVARLRPW